MNENEYINIVKGIINTANNSDPAYILNNGKYSISDFYTLINSDDFKKAGYNAVLNSDGSVRTYTYTNTNGQIDNSGSDVDGGINSNTQTGTSSGTVEFTQPIDTTMTTATETDPSVVQSFSKMTKFTNGVKGVGNFVFGSVLPAINAASTGIALGKIIDKGIYEVGTNIFGADNLEAFDPDTWGSITAGDDSLGARAFNNIFGINPNTGDTQMYMDENALAYLAYYMAKKGVFDEGESAVYENDKIKSLNLSKYIDFPIKLSPQLFQIVRDSRFNKENPNYLYTDVFSTSAEKVAIFRNYNTDDGTGRIIFSSNNAGKFGDDFGRGILQPIPNENHSLSPKTLYNHEFYMSSLQQQINGIIIGSLNIQKTSIPGNVANDIGYALLYGDTVTSGVIDGITNQDGAKTPYLSALNSIADALNALKSQYPELWDNRVENNVVQPDGTTKTYTYIPVPMPTGGVGDKPTTPGASQDKPSVNPADATDTLRKTIIKILTQPKPVGMVDTAVNPVNPNPPDTGSGKTPILTPPTGASNALYSIYNPTQSQLNSFGAWLWSSNFADQILKVFNDPMQAIIGLHKVFAKPSISGTGNIKVGYLDSGVSSNIVGGQYTTVDCGSVNLYEYYGNVFDYDPYTKINLYLPFIGIVPLNTGEVMRSTIHVVYHIDVLTGACLAEVKIIRDMAGGTLYQYTGNAAVQYPISSGSYMGIVSGILSIAGGIAGTIATGGAAMPVLLGAGASVGRMHTDISHSGSFSGNAGAMGIKKPYLIIDRPQSSLAKNFQNYIGYPSNHTDTLGSCSGYVRVKEVHLEGIPATQNELNQIESILKEGVII